MRPSPFQSSRRPRGFTLIELMISVAIVLILMLGINFVFTTSARTVSVGMALSNAGRELRGARRVLEDDFKNSVTPEEMPALVIHNEAVYAWRDKLDKLADLDGNPWTYDVNGGNLAGDTNSGDEVDMSAAAYLNQFNFRHHRQDRISFFLSKLSNEYTRQTGDDNTYIAGDTSTEAWVCYGLARLAANDDVSYWKPGGRNLTGPVNLQDERGNQNNFFASQWVLARKLTLLKKDLSSGNYQTNLYYGVANAAIAPTPAMLRQTKASNTGPYNTATNWQTQESRLDITNGSIADVRDYMVNLLTPPPLGLGVAYPWWGFEPDATTNAAGTNRDVITYLSALPANTYRFNYLFWAKPFVDKAAFATSLAAQTRETALTTPIFLRGCSQIMVEFAGDFFEQTAPERVGTVDYDNVPGPGGGPQIRWYGMDRDVDGNGVVTAGSGDVTNIAAFAAVAGNIPRYTALNFEHLPPGAPPAPPAPRDPSIWAWGPTTGAKPIGDGVAPSTPGDPSWVRPSLIRITIELVDANGRLPDGQRMEFIYALKK